MNKSEIVSLLNNNPVCCLGTSDKNVPHVRTILMYQADEKGIIFHTGTQKDLYRQLIQNPNVELCFSIQKPSMQIRVMGNAELIVNDDLVREIYEKRPFLQAWAKQYPDQKVAVFRVKNCKACCWTMETNFEEKQFIAL